MNSIEMIAASAYGVWICLALALVMGIIYVRILMQKKLCVLNSFSLLSFFAVWTGVLTLSFIALLVKYFSLSVEAQMLMGMCISVGTFISLLYIHCWKMRK